jgi:hypothetical protein
VTSRNGQLNNVVNKLSGLRLDPLSNKTVGMSLNLTPPGGTLSWHYDRNLVTAVVYLNEVEGGNIELYPRYRVRVPNNHFGVRKFVQRVFDVILRPEPVRRVLGRKISLRPRTGSVCVMDSTCLYQVQQVVGDRSRAAIIFCYDDPNITFAKHQTKDYYGYRDQKTSLDR